MQGAVERWAPASSLPTGRRPRPGHFARVAVRRGGCDGARGERGEEAHRHLRGRETPPPCRCPRVPTDGGDVTWPPPAPHPTQKAARLGRSDRGRPASELTRLTVTLPHPKTQEVRQEQDPRNPGQLLTFDFFGKLDPLGICQRFLLFFNTFKIQNFTHKLDYWLCLIKRGC